MVIGIKPLPSISVTLWCSAVIAYNAKCGSSHIQLIVIRLHCTWSMQAQVCVCMVLSAGSMVNSHSGLFQTVSHITMRHTAIAMHPATKQVIVNVQVLWVSLVKHHITMCHTAIAVHPATKQVGQCSMQKNIEGQ